MTFAAALEQAVHGGAAIRPVGERETFLTVRQGSMFLSGRSSRGGMRTEPGGYAIARHYLGEWEVSDAKGEPPQEMTLATLFHDWLKDEPKRELSLADVFGLGRDKSRRLTLADLW